MGKIVRTIAASAGFFYLLQCLGCGPGTTQQTANQQQGATMPSITQVQPQSIPAGTQSTTIKVTGTNFPAQAAILWNGAPLSTTVVDSNTLSSTVGSTSLATPTTVQLQVQNTQTMQASSAVPLAITGASSGSAPAALTISITSLPQGVVGAPYNGTLTISGGTAPYTWSVSSGQLPPGLSLSAASGAISGTPTSAGNFSFSIKVIDSSASVQSATTTVSLPVVVATVAPPPLAITTSSIPTGSIGSAYSSVLQSSGGTAPYAWSITSGGLPNGLSLSASTGLISGTPTSIGSTSFTAMLADSSNPTQTKSVSLTLVVAPLPLAITSSSLPAGTVGSTYQGLLQATGGIAPYTWSITGGLPAGLSLAPTGIISGTPTASGTFNFTATAADAGNPAQTKSVPIVIVITPVTLAISTSALPSGTQNSGYSAALQAFGGTGTYAWSISSGTLPAGLSLAPATGVISGTPTASGNSSFKATVTDTGSPAQKATATINISIVAAGTALAISSTSLPAGKPNKSYSATLNATGGTAPYSWSITSGALPSGISLSSSGVISGKTAVSGTTSLTFQVTDSSSTPQTQTATLSLAIAPIALSITTSSLPSGTKGTSYSNLVQASGGTTPYTWSISGSLPAGLSMSTSTGLISGTPTAAGTANFTVTVTDAGGPAQTKSVPLSIVIAAPTPSALAITSSSLAAGTNGTSYSGALQASGGTSPYAWSITAGSLPAGLGLNPTTGLISGTPTATGTSNFTATVTDGGSPAQTKSVSLTIMIEAPAPPALTITTSSMPAGKNGTSYSNSLQASGGSSPYAWSITSGSLPAGLTLTATSGLISGTPTATGTSNFTATVTDSGSPAQTKSAPLSIVVAGASGSALTINATLPSGTAGTAYSNPMSASGGTPAYTWSITSGSLPSGLTLAATTGIISGTPSASGTFNFTATVTDSTTPTAQTQSASTSIVVAAATAPSGPGTTWYIRPDGGTRYSANVPTGQCDGQADVAYSGTGTNQHCAFNDYRFLYDDQSYQNSGWVIAGGDTVIIRGGPYRVGVSQGTTPADVWCNGEGNPYGCTNPTIPAGSPTQHTRILGENYGSCSQSNMTQLYGGFGLFNVINLGGAQYVDIQCIELTRHSQCIRIGVPAVPSYCSSSFPVDDYAANGMTTDTNTHDILLQDMWIHGFTSRGIIGPIGGAVTATRVDIAYNGGAGWDFDDGNGTANVNGVLNLSYVTIEWNGCNQVYPGTGAISCYSQSTGGYGDGIGTPEATCLSAYVDHSIFRYNTQDGYDMLHNDAGNCSMSISYSTSYGNNGAQFKWGPNDNPMVFTNNTAVANCMRLSAPFQGQPSTYNANLADFCRASDAIAFGFRDGGTLLMANNTFVTYAPTTFDASCSGTYPQAQGQGTCLNSTFIFENNISYGIDNPNTYSVGGQSGGPGVFYYGSTIGNVIRNNNVYYGFRPTSFVCPTGIATEQCADPLFVNESVFSGESSLDNFNFKITSGSPAVGTGLYIPSITLDYSGIVRPNPPSIGALEP